MKKHRRRKLIIEGNFQTRFILRFVVMIVGATLLSTAAIIGLFYFKYQFRGADLNNLVIMVTPEGTTSVASLFQIVLFPLLIVNLIVLCIIIPLSLLYSHRIAGPIYRFEQSLDLLLNDETNFMIVLREKDEFKYLADKMNALVDYLRRNIGEVRSSHRTIKERVSKLADLIKKEPVDLDAVKREIGELEKFFMERGVPFKY